ncbi:MAG: lipocalin family protein [Verrucomicrobia bacterium]|nr:lipocalin family protein [Verrucomicrobiota bacterium]
MSHPLTMEVSLWRIFLPVLSFGLVGCATHKPLATVESVDLPRFMGTWYVHYYSPLVVDRDAVNAIEHYHLRPDGRIATTYQFRRSDPQARLRTFTPTGFIYDTDTQAEWRMQFIWPFKAQYLIIALDEDYGGTVIAHPNRKYAWIMHRSVELDPVRLQRHMDVLQANGFDVDSLTRVIHDWESDAVRKAYIEGLPVGSTFTFRE